MNGNIGYLFTKDFYRDGNTNELCGITNKNDMRKKVDDICNASPLAATPRLKSVCFPFIGQDAAPDGIQSFTLKLLYPGLYTGLGYAHGQSGGGDAANQDVKAGFAFDHTTGLPYLPGSGVKGALRACFINHPEDVLPALQKIMGAAANAMTAAGLKELENALFGGEKSENMGAGVFFDAFPCAEARVGGILRLMARDSITPHKHPLQDPQPINTIKVRAGVVWRFCFRLTDISLRGGLTVTAAQQSALFKQLLCDWGVGAKTNTGYGSFAEA